MKAHTVTLLGAAVLLTLLVAVAGITPAKAQARPTPAGFDCTAVTGLSTPECQALVALYDSTNGAGWVNHNGWLTTYTPCDWFGVTCDAGHVIFLYLI